MGYGLLSGAIFQESAGTEYTYINWADYNGGGSDLSDYASMYIPETVGPNTGIECRFQVNANGNGWPWVVAPAVTKDSNGYKVSNLTGPYVSLTNGNARYRFYYWGTRIEPGLEAGSDITVFFDKNVLKYRTSDSSSYTTQNTYTKTSSSQTGIYIKFNDYARAANYANSTRIYYFNVYQNGTLTRNLIPFYQNSTRGLYDTVSNTFFANSIGGTCTVNTSKGTYYIEHPAQNFLIGS